MVFQVNLRVSTAHGLENLVIFIEDMPDKFEKEKIDLHFERVEMSGMEMLAARMLAMRPNLTFRKMSIGIDPIAQGNE